MKRKKPKRHGTDFDGLDTTQEIAEFLGVCDRTIQNWAGTIIPCLKIGKTVRFERDRVLEALRKFEITKK